MAKNSNLIGVSGGEGAGTLGSVRGVSGGLGQMFWEAPQAQQGGDHTILFGPWRLPAPTYTMA